MNYLEKIITDIQSDLELSKNIRITKYTQNIDKIETSIIYITKIC